MDLHFISTGPFGYVHMLSVWTAAQTQKVDKINLWYTEAPTGVYFDAIKDLVKPIRVSVSLPKCLEGKDSNFASVHNKDLLQWRILSVHGGLCMDLDVISLTDITSLLGDGLMYASLDVEDRTSIAFPFNNSVVCVDSTDAHIPRPLQSIQRFVDGVLQGDVVWGLTGPIAVSTIFNEYLDSVPGGESIITVVPHKVLCPWGGNEIQQIYQESTGLVLPAETRVIHLYAKASGNLFDQVNAEWVKSSNSLLANIVRANVPPAVWEVSAGWDLKDYLHRRGRHYLGLFELIEANRFQNILEIGTSFGETAIGMIKMAGKVAGGEDAIHYYGIDLFEEGTPVVWDAEFSGGYRPPCCAEVERKLRQNTKSHIRLTAGNSRQIRANMIPPTELVYPEVYTSWPEMDLIYIDGGHSIETVQSDWGFAQRLMHSDTAVVFDDYFPEMPFIGCKVVVDGIDRDMYDVVINPIYDDYNHPWGRLRTQLVLVKKRMTPVIPAQANPRADWAGPILKKVIGR